MIGVIDNVFLASFNEAETELASTGPAAFHEIRKAAIEGFEELGFPTARNEDWRFTSVAALAKIPFRLATTGDRKAAAELARRFGIANSIQIVCVNGRLAPELSSISTLPPGLRVAGLASVLKDDPDAVEPYLTRFADYEDHALVALNTAFLHDGAFISLAKNQVVEKPIHVLHIATGGGAPTVAHPRALILAGVNSQATIIETFAGQEGQSYFTNTVTEIIVNEGAILDHYKIQQESKDAFHIATLQIQQDRTSRFSNHSVTLGGLLARNDINAVLDGEGCECTLNGLYLGSGKQLIDNHTRIDHAKPHCASHEVYKGILDGKANGVFNGKIYVHQDAQKTDAKQTNKTLLLSDDAVINTKPQLEIYADDVKCTHGATVGQLAAEAIFYLRSRGIPLAEARSLLTYAFANEILNQIKVESLRARLEDILLAQQHLPHGRQVGEAL